MKSDNVCLKSIRLSLLVLTTLLAACEFSSTSSSSVMTESASQAANKLEITEPSADAELNRPFALRGTCRTGSHVQVEASGLPVSTFVQCRDGKFVLQIVPKSGADGIKSIAVTQRVDRIAYAASRSFTQDTTPPQLGLITDLNTAANGAALLLVGICEANFPVRITGSALNMPVDAPCVAGEFRAQLSLNTGAVSKELVVMQIDRAGNASRIQRSLVVDMQAPVVRITSPAANTENSSGLTIGGTCETGLPVTVSGSGVKASLQVPCSSNSFTAALLFSDNLGSKQVEVRQVDAAGNQGSDTRLFTRIAPPASSPTIRIAQPAADSYVTGSIMLSGTCTAGLNVQISGTGAASSQSVTCPSGSFSATVPPSANDGLKNIVVTQTSASNVSSSDTRTFRVDTIAPTLSISSPLAGFAHNTGLTLKGSCETGLTVNIAGSGVNAATTACSTNAYSVNLTFTANDGTKDVRVSQTDAAGNTSTVPRSFIRDNVAPTVKITGPDAGTLLEASVTLVGTCETGPAVSVAGAGVSSAVSLPCTNSAFSGTVALSSGNGQKLLTVSQTDAAGNTGTDARSFLRGSGEVNLDGVQLYANNCAACHGALSASTKLDRTASQISSAITNVSQMSAVSSLKALTSAQITAIETALRSNSSGPVAAMCTAPEKRGLSRHSLRRLSREEIRASMHQIFPAFWAFESDLNAYPEVDEMDDVAKFDPLFSETQAITWLRLVDRLAEEVEKRAEPQYRVGGGCFQAATITEDCWKNFFTNYGRKVFRRPLTGAEVTGFTNLVKGLSAADGRYNAIHMLFRAPEFLFHIENGSSVEGNRVRLTDHEIANRISYGIIGKAPDETLATAADRGELKTLAQVEAQVRRLIETQDAKNKLRTFFGEWLQIKKIGQPSDTYIDWIAHLGRAPGMEKAYQTEIHDYLLHVIWKEKGSFRDLMTRPIALPRQQGVNYSDGAKPWSPMAGIYGASAMSGFNPDGTTDLQAFPAPNHPGLIMRAGFLSGGKFETNPITRGVYILRRVLCENLPSPDFNVVNARLNDVGKLDPFKLANHEIVSAKTSGTACMTCHSRINPIGFALEGYDPLGKPRSKEDVYNQSNLYQPPISHALPYPVANVILGGSTVTLNAPTQLAAELAENRAVRNCMVTYALRHFERRRETSNDSCSLADMIRPLDEGKPVLDMFVNSVANEDIFWRGL